MTVRSPRPSGLYSLVLVAAVFGCGGQGEPQASVRALYRVARGEVTPFPSDLFTRQDHGTPTGRRVDLPPEGTPVIEQGLPVLMEREEFTGLLNAFDGFSTWAPALVPLSGEIDEGTLPAGPEDSVLPGSSVFIVDVSTDSPTYAHRIPVRVEYWSFEEKERPEHVLSVRPPTSPTPRAGAPSPRTTRTVA